MQTASLSSGDSIARRDWFFWVKHTKFSSSRDLRTAPATSTRSSRSSQINDASLSMKVMETDDYCFGDY